IAIVSDTDPLNDERVKKWHYPNTRKLTRNMASPSRIIPKIRFMDASILYDEPFHVPRQLLLDECLP
ncbi:MAG TPA: hypothetical protein VJ044_17795, partial [Candidatus Hodarchaeales archaeon]|nr:hypothetical protein [Candidatus Hodarchaeales archaeon]